jgi:hypothetical protein
MTELVEGMNWWISLEHQVRGGVLDFKYVEMRLYEVRGGDTYFVKELEE